MRLQPGMRRLRSIAALAALVVLMLLAAAASLFAVLLGTPLPASLGTVGIAGLHGPVDIIRDREGVPHIFATTVDDLWGRSRLCPCAGAPVADGAHAPRRAGALVGRSSAKGTVASDIFLRTLDLNGHAERSFAALPQDSKALLEAYARGVNAFIISTQALSPRGCRLSFFCSAIGRVLAPVDGILAAKIIALTLGTNLDREIRRWLISRQIEQRRSQT